MTFFEYVQKYHDTLCPETKQAPFLRQLLTKLLTNPAGLPKKYSPYAMSATTLSKYYRGLNNLSGPAPAWLPHLDSAAFKEDLEKLDHAQKQALRDAFAEDLPHLRPSQVPAQLAALLENILREAAAHGQHPGTTQLPASDSYHLFVLDTRRIPAQGPWHFTVPPNHALCDRDFNDKKTREQTAKLEPDTIRALLRHPALILAKDSNAPARLARLEAISPGDDGAHIDCTIAGTIPRQALLTNPDDYALAHRPGTSFHELNTPHWSLKHIPLKKV